MTKRAGSSTSSSAASSARPPSSSRPPSPHPSAIDTHLEETRLSDDAVPSPDGAVIAVMSGSARGAIARIPGEIGGIVRVGKSSSNDLVIPDDTVSRQHLTITRTVEGIAVRDESSRNGTRIAASGGWAKITEAVVEPGTLLRVGEVEVLVRVELKGVEVPPSKEGRFGLAIGESLPMRRIFGVLERIAPTSATVLLLGETGTGKDVLARSIHAMSPRRDRPFEVVDCGAVTPSLIESELFGHERGAFTGAVSARAGAFERASAQGGGTLFLDEIGELPIELQPKLLRVLEAKELRRVGGNKVIKSEARIVAATTRDLLAEVKRGKFREDLYFRLAVVPIDVPPLRARLEDLPALARKILDGTEEGRGLTVSDRVISELRAQAWAGNVRELRNVLERAAYLSRGTGDDELRLPPLKSDPASATSDGDDVFAFHPGVSYRDARARVDMAFERKFVAWLLGRHQGNVSAAAREAQMDRKHLAELAKKHGVAGRWEG